MNDIYTIGHSTHPYERFLALLRSADINAIADVRSFPYSRRFPHFSREVLKSELRLDGLSYVFLGNELGGRPKQPHLFVNGIADYERMALEATFKAGLARLFEGARKFRIALLCSEQDPIDCHRCLLVGRAIFESGGNVRHILSDGKALDQPAIEQRLLHRSGGQTGDLFSNTEGVSAAYRKQAFRCAHAESREKPEITEMLSDKAEFASGRKR
jgi:hypothetical protein